MNKDTEGYRVRRATGAPVPCLPRTACCCRPPTALSRRPRTPEPGLPAYRECVGQHRYRKPQVTGPEVVFVAEADVLALLAVIALRVAKRQTLHHRPQRPQKAEDLCMGPHRGVVIVYCQCPDRMRLTPDLARLCPHVLRVLPLPCTPRSPTACCPRHALIQPNYTF